MEASMVTRRAQLLMWLRHCLAEQDIRIEPLAGDASTRRYYRVFSCKKSFIAAEVHPLIAGQKDFVLLTHVLASCGIAVPTIHRHDLTNGFLLLSDFGDTLYFDVLDDRSADALYRRAFQVLLRIQAYHPRSHWRLPYYDHTRYMQELNLFRTWFLQRLLGHELTEDEAILLQDLFGQLIRTAQAQPHVLVHRDFHSRNLMLLGNNEVGVLDFQDAVWGPVTYDVVSLLRDAYIDWPDAQVMQWAYHYYENAVNAGILVDVDFSEFVRWLDWMGLQRHLKVLGIFSRLYFRDGKSRYLWDIPRVLGYVLDISRRYSAFQPLYRFLLEKGTHLR